MGAKEVTELIADFVNAVNRGDQAAAVAHFTDDVTIVEDLRHFAGTAECRSRMDAGDVGECTAQQCRRGRDAISPPMRIAVEEGAAYAVVPGLLTYERPGSVLRSEGLLTFSLIARGGKWLISALTWGGPVAT